MISTAERSVQRVSFRDAAAQLRTNAGIDRAADVAAVRPVAAIGVSARRLRASNSFEPSGSSAVTGTLLATVEISWHGRYDAHARNRDIAARADLGRRIGELADRATGLLGSIEAARRGQVGPVTRPTHVQRVVRIERVVRVERVERVVRPTVAPAPTAAASVPVVAIVPIEGPLPQLGIVPPSTRAASARSRTLLPASSTYCPPGARDAGSVNTADFGKAARRLRAAYDTDCEDWRAVGSRRVLDHT